jgi:hypothetical protein
MILKFTLERTGNPLFVVPPYAVTDLGDWRDSTARVNGEARAIIHYQGQEFRVQETAEEAIKGMK